MRERAITLGNIAHILEQKGDSGAARRWYEEGLQTLRKCDDTASIAGILYALATLDLASGHIQEAAPKLAEAHALVERMNHAEGLAQVGAAFGPVLFRTGKPEQGRAVLTRSIECFTLMGDNNQAEKVTAVLHALENQ